MTKLRLLLSLLLRVFHTIKKAPIIRFNNPKSDYIIWAPDFFTFNHILGDNFQKNIFTYYHLKKLNLNVCIYFRKDIGRFYKKKIIYFGSKSYNTYRFSNYVNSMIFITENLELQNNLVFPNSIEVKLWENKAFMHDYFKLKNIRTPDSKVVKLNKSLEIFDQFNFPYLLKEVHSCSSNGVHKITSKEILEFIFNKYEILENNQEIIVQKLLNIRRDLRVIIVGNEIVLHYWRINLSSEWKPTSTGQGNKVDFGNFPEIWRSWILESFKKLNIRTGAFDIAWEDDNLDTEPYILEVSPFYQPNPAPLNDNDLLYYGNWKKSVRIFNSYQKSIAQIIFDIQDQFVKQIF